MSERLAEVEKLLADGEAAEAQRRVKALLATDPDEPRALYLAGRIERLSGRPDAAQELLRKALAADPSHVESHLELAAVLRAERNFDACLDELGAALYADPANARAYFELGSVHRLQGKLDGAEEFLKKAVENDPDMVRAYIELGWIYLMRERYPEAIAVLEKAIELDPASLIGKVNLGNAYEHAGQFDKSQRVWEEILLQEPNNLLARWNRAHSLLSRQQFEEGWSNYEYRFHVEGAWRPRMIPFAPWQGEPLAGKSIVVVAEQGLGDQIMFGSCIGELAAQAGRVVWECEHRLAALMQRSFPNVQVIGSRHDLVPPWLRQVGDIDYQVSICSLASFFRRRREDFPAHQGYLLADAGKVAHWRAELERLGPGLKVGFSWRGGTPTTRRRLRSIGLRDLRGLLAVPGCRFVSLQYGDVAAELAEARREGIELQHWQGAIDDYDETAALCCALDLTVSVCTAVIHLNGALGRPVWVMVPSVPEWRYARSGESMPWYPSVRLYRQQPDGPWDEVFGRVAADLAARAR